MDRAQVDLTGIADHFGVSRERADGFSRSEQFPPPIAEPPDGRIWDLDAVRTWNEETASITRWECEATSVSEAVSDETGAIVQIDAQSWFGRRLWRLLRNDGASGWQFQQYELVQEIPTVAATEVWMLIDNRSIKTRQVPLVVPVEGDTPNPLDASWQLPGAYLARFIAANFDRRMAREMVLMIARSNGALPPPTPTLINED